MRFSVHRRSSILISISCLFLAGDGVGAHEAKTGWRYPYACCSNKDCREVPARMVDESAEGYVIRTTGEIISYDDKRIRHSPDGVFHWCSISGKADTKTICLFVPPKAF